MTQSGLAEPGRGLVRVLVTRVQAADQEQLRLLAGGISRRHAYRLRSRLMDEGWLRMIETYAKRPGNVELFGSWAPGEKSLNAGKISYATKRKWSNTPLLRVKAFAATTKAAGYFGMPVARLKRHQIGHDLAVTDLLLRCMESRPRLISEWRGEAIMAKHRSNPGDKLPDVFLVSDYGTVRGVLEICSGYSTERIRECIADCETRQLPLEIWG